MTICNTREVVTWKPIRGAIDYLLFITMTTQYHMTGSRSSLSYMNMTIYGKGRLHQDVCQDVVILLSKPKELSENLLKLGCNTKYSLIVCVMSGKSSQQPTVRMYTREIWCVHLDMSQRTVMKGKE